VVGEPGVGKSRLVREMADRAAAEGAIVLWGRSDEEPLGPYQAFAGVIGQYLRTLSPTVVASMPQWRLAELSRLVPALREYVPTRIARELSDPQTDRNCRDGRCGTSKSVTRDDVTQRSNAKR
jgi:hypothetical protein